MLDECRAVFAERLKEKGERLILDSYIPAEGTYLIVERDGSIGSITDLVKDKKTKEIDCSSLRASDLFYYDYYSQLISMNKPMDVKKIIHSNSYLSFFVKKESLTNGKLTREVIDGYFEVLADPMGTKYQKSKEASRIYEQFAREKGEVDQEKLEFHRSWILEHIFSLENVDMSRKDYLKIFFRADREEYRREGNRYFLPNVYNNNSYNTEIDGETYGLPDNNLGMNAKKPFLSIKTRKNPASYLLNGEEVILQKQFFDYLLNMASARKNHIYIDTKKREMIPCGSFEYPGKIENGYYLKIRKGKTEAEIWEQDNICNYSSVLNPVFEFKNFLQVFHDPKVFPKQNGQYRTYDNKSEIALLVDQIFFFGKFGGRYDMEPDEIQAKEQILKNNMVLARKAWDDWFRKGTDHGIIAVMERTVPELIRYALINEKKNQALRQFNLKWSLERYLLKDGGCDMGEIITEIRKKVEEKILSKQTSAVDSDREYFYCVGQLAAYLLSLSKAKDNKQSLLNPILNARTDEEIKKRVRQLYKKYNYAIPAGSTRVKNLLALVMGYVPDDKIDQESIMLGYACDNIIYNKTEEK